MAYFAQASFETLFRRCLSCDSGAAPLCPPTCPQGQICQLTPPSCNACQSTTCIDNPDGSSSTAAASSSSVSASKSGPNSGAIAGGVIGGVIAIALATYLVWRFCIKTKRQQYEQDDWVDNQQSDEPAEKDFTMRRDARASTHTVGSIASTVLTRASNIIQIAYIPGVTNRSAPSTPGLLVPPVPPIPIALSSAASTPRYEQEHFFMPGDLRDSTYSGVSDRTSYARTSVASTIYGKNAVVSPVPAQTVIRGKAAVVSVKSAGLSSPSELTPPVPSVDYDKYTSNPPPSPAFSVGSTFLSNANSATTVRPQLVRVASGAKKAPSKDSLRGQEDSNESLLPRDSNAITIIDDTPTMSQGPFSDPVSPRQNSSGGLSVVKETKGESDDSRGSTPFGDEHEVKES